MKRLSYILPIVFLLSILSPIVFTLNTPNNLAFAQVGCTSPVQIPQGNEEEGCYLINAPGRIPYSDPLEIVSDQFSYEDTFVWIEFLVRENLTIQKRPFGYVPTVVLGGGNGIETNAISNEDGSCQYHTFTYQRPSLTKDYKVPLESEEIIIKDGKEVKKCIYSPTEIIIDLIDLGGLGTEEEILKVIEGGGECSDCKFKVCTDLVEGRDPETGVCPEEETCRVEIFQGTKQNYGVKFKKDDCGESGNRVVELDNSGLPIDWLDSPREKTTSAPARVPDVPAFWRPDYLFLRQCKNEQPREKWCGDGIVDIREECDSHNLNGRYCSDVDTKFTSGELSCNSECKFDTSKCYYNVKANILVDTHINILNAKKEPYRPTPINDYVTFDGKVLVTLQVDKIKDSQPDHVRYMLRNEGGKIFGGVYGASMREIIKQTTSLKKVLEESKITSLEDILQKPENGFIGGFIGFGIAYDYEDKDNKLIIKEMNSRDLNLEDFLETKTKPDDWKVSEIIIEIDRAKKQIKVSQKIWTDDINSPLFKGDKVLDKDIEDIDKLIEELLERFLTYEGKNGKVENREIKGLIDIDDLKTRIRNGEKIEAGWEVKQFGDLVQKLNQKTTVTYTNVNVDEVIKHLEVIGKQQSSTQENNPDLQFAWAFSPNVGLT